MTVALPRHGALLGAALWLVWPGWQDPAPPSGQTQPTFRTGVSLVRVDVTVTTSNGTPVSDLMPEDFEVREDGTPQQIESFQLVQLGGDPAPGDDLSLDIRSIEHGRAEAAREDVRVFALFLDDYHITRQPAITARLREGLTDFVRNQLRPTDLVAVMDPLTPLSALTFTRSRDELLERIRKLEGRRGVYMPVRSVLEEAQLASRNVLRLRAEVTITALNALVTHLGGLRERRTSVLFLSEGPALRFYDGDLEYEFQEVLKAANRGNVTINCLDPSGLSGASPSDTLWRLAGETGGRALVNTNDLRPGLEQVVRDASAYYLLGYVPSREQNAGGFRRIEVEVRRRGARVLARRGYWAPGEEELAAPPPTTAPVALVQSLESLSELARRRLVVTWLGFEPAQGRTTRLRLVWQPNVRGEPAATPAAAVALTLRDEQDRIVAEERVAASATDETAAGAGRPAQAMLEAPPGPSRLSIVVQDAAGEVLDRMTEAIAIPDFSGDRPVFGTPQLLLARSPLEYRALVANLPVAIPTPLRDFRRTDRVLVRAPLWLPGPAPAIAVDLLNRAGDRLAGLPIKAPGATGNVEAELPLASLATGDYVLRLQTNPDEPSAAAFVAFRVVP